MKADVNETDARELSLFAENDGDLCRARVQPIIANLARKVAAGTYDAARALTLWRYAADDAAQRYTRAHGSPGPNGSFGCFDTATRQAVAAMLAEGYAEQVAEVGADLKAERDNRKRWTLGAVKAANEAAGHYFFSRETMRFFGDTMASFRVVCEGRDVCLERVRAAGNAPDGAGGIGKRYTFHPETGHINAHERARMAEG